MQVSFVEPMQLLWLLLLPLFWLVERRSLAGLGTARRRFALLLRVSIVASLSLALAEPQWDDQGDVVEVAFVVDRSRSIPRELQSQTLSTVSALNARPRQKDDRSRLVVFAKEVATEAELSVDSPSIEAVESVIGLGQSRLAAALEHALNRFPKASKKRIVLFSDGNETDGDAVSVARAARSRGAIVDVVPLSYSSEREVLIEKLLLPAQVKVGEPYVVRVVLRSLSPCKVTLDLFENDSRIGSRKLELDAGLRVVKFMRVLDRPGFFNIRALLRCEEGGDRVFQNNQAFGFVYVRGESRLLYIHGQGMAPSRPLLEALALERIAVEVRNATNVPAESQLLRGYEAVVLDNVPKAHLTLGQQRAIARCVRDLGLGLVMIGGSEGYGAGGWSDGPSDQTPLEQVIPLRMAPKQKMVLPKGAVVYIMHSCEFPNGNQWARDVVQASIDVMSAKDYAGVVQYGQSGCEWVIPLKPVINKRSLKRRVQAMDPGDMPDFDPSLRLAIESLRRSPVTLRHLIILSDGDPSPPTMALMQQCREHKITASTLAISPHNGRSDPGVSLMKRIARSTGGRFYYVDDPTKLPKIFVKETKRIARSLLRNVRVSPRRVSSSPVLTGLGTLPPLNGHVLTTVKETATLVLETAEKDAMPLLAHWHPGAGKSLAVTFDSGVGWASGWTSWSGYTAFWGQVMRWAAKEVTDATFQVSTKVTGSEGVVVVDAIDDLGDFINGLSVSGVATGPEGFEASLNLEARGPGRYEGRFPVDRVGSYSIALRSQSSEGKDGQTALAGLVVPYSNEFRETRSNEGLLRQIAKESGGLYLDLAQLDAYDPFDHDLESSNGFIAKWPLFLLIALALFPLDVVVRRVMIDLEALLGRGTSSDRPDEPGETLARLKDGRIKARARFIATATELEAASPLEVEAYSSLPRSPSMGEESQENPGAPAADEGEQDFTSRLLAAKRRAQQRLDEATREDESKGP